MKKILVTGGAGFVGSHLIPLLLENGYMVTAVVKAEEVSRINDKRIKVITGDLSEKSDWVRKIGGYDTLIHLAAQISSKSPDEFKKNNVVATRNLIEAAKKEKIKRIILFSSAAVTSSRQDPYSKTKMEQEVIVKHSGIDFIIIRPSMIYGPGDTKNMGWLISFVKKYPIIPLPGGGHFGRQPVFVEDLCEIVVKVLKTNIKDKTYEIHGYEYVPMRKMIAVIIKNLKSKRIIVYVPISVLKLVFWLGQFLIPNPKFTLDQIESVVSGEKFHGDNWWQTFDIKPTEFDEGISQMMAN